jgi:hypothetical protein
MEFLKKTWKFFLGIVVTILGTLLIFRKDDSGELIEKSTRAGNDALDKVIESNITRNEKEAKAVVATEKEIERIKKIFEKRKKEVSETAAIKIQKRLDNKNPLRATQILAEELGIKNLDDVK